MDVKVFKTFLEVAKTRHFGRASENLFITQAAVSARVKQLEDYIGASLFQRTRNNIQLTPAGQRLIPYAETMVRALKQAKTSASLAEEDIVQLSIAATPGAWESFLQNYLTILTESQAHITLHTEMLSQNQINTGLLQGTLDVGILYDPLLSETIVCKKLADIELILVSTHKQDKPRRTFDKDHVYIDWGTQFASEHAARYGDNTRSFLHVPTARIALDYILAKGGSAFLPADMVTPFIGTGQLHQVEAQDAMYRTIHAAYQLKNEAAVAIQKLIQAMTEEAPQTPFIMENSIANLQDSR
ncbi:MAG: LysR family transcriptional regulator [Aestuariibacter sp.]